MVRLVVKNAGQPDFPIELSDDATVGDLKGKLQESYPSRPTPVQQKLIFAGRLLNDGSQSLLQLITSSKYDAKTPQAVHLVLPPPSLHSSSSGLPSSPAINRIQAQPDLRRSAPAGLGDQHNVPQPLALNGQPHPRFVPGNGVAPPFPRPQFAAAAPPQAQAAAAAPPAAAPRPAGPGLLGRQNWFLLAKLVVFIYILSQGGGSTRLSILCFGAFIVYLYQMGLFPRLHRPAAPAPAPAVAQEAQAAPAEPVADAPAPQADRDPVAVAPPVAVAIEQQQQPARAGLWKEVENIFLPFLYSLIPTWQPVAMAQPVPLPGGQPPQVHHNHPHHD